MHIHGQDLISLIWLLVVKGTQLYCYDHLVKEEFAEF